MPIKIFAAPGDTRNDFEQVEMQANQWMDEKKPQVISMHMTVNQMPGTPRDSGSFMMTLLVYHGDTSS